MNKKAFGEDEFDSGGGGGTGGGERVRLSMRDVVDDECYEQGCCCCIEVEET